MWYCLAVLCRLLWGQMPWLSMSSLTQSRPVRAATHHQHQQPPPESLRRWGTAVCPPAVQQQLEHLTTEQSSVLPAPQVCLTWPERQSSPMIVQL